MCDVPRFDHPQPRWTALYAIVTTSIGLLLLTQAATVLAWRVGVSATVLLASTAASLTWIHANRVALDQREWCECARATIAVRVVQAPVATSTPERGATLVA